MLQNWKSRDAKLFVYDVIVSGQYDPLLNLAFESCLFDRFKEGDRPLLYLWVNDSSVFMGRFQNPWQECRLPLMKQHNIPLLRRNSGGGCVYHDSGNLNFTFITSKDTYSKTGNLDFLIDFLASLETPVTAVRNKRNDLVIPGTDGQADRKFSGSAYREKKNKAYHHGTLLINTDLEKLLSFLRPADSSIKTKATDSVRSRVVNLNELNSDLNSEYCIEALNKFCEAGSEKPFNFHNFSKSEIIDYPGMDSYLEILGSDDWIYGKTPAFSFCFDLPENREFSSVSVPVEKGCASALDLTGRETGVLMNLSFPAPVSLISPAAPEILETYCRGLELNLKKYL